MSIRRRASRAVCAMLAVAGIVLAPDVASAAGNGRYTSTLPVEAAKGHSPVKPNAAGAERGGSDRLQGWGNPAFSDDFDDASLPKWNVRDNWRLNQDKAVTSKQNVEVSDGRLTIRTKRLAKADVRDASRRYSSGYLDTVGKFSQKYGRFEVRAKLPTVKNNSRGVWPAFWLRPDGGQGNEGEIDVFEAYGTPDQGNADVDPYGRSEATAHVYQPSRHGGLQAPEGRKKKNAWTPQSINLNDGKFHTWAAEWTPGRIAFFIDGRKYHEVTKETWGSATWNKFFTTDKFNIRLNVQVGSPYWGLPEPGKTADSTEFVVDYVRAWAYRG